MYRIGEFSSIVKITVKALRFYDESNLFKPSYVDKFTGYRYYTLDQLYSLQQILALRQAGFSIEETKSVLLGKNIEELLVKKEGELRREKADAESKLRRLTAIKIFYTENKNMEMQAIIKKIPEYVVFYKRFYAKSYKEYGSIIPSIGEAVTKANPTLKCVEPGFCYIEGLDGEYREENVHAEYVEAVEKMGIETDGIKFKTLPSATVASVMLKGGYDGISGAYAYLINWVNTNGYTIAGNGREQYIDGIWNKENEEDYLTEIQIPIKTEV